MFWFSHIPKARIQEFLLGLHSVLEKGSIVFIGDNVFNQESGGVFVTKPNMADTHKIRTLADGSTHEIIKNYYDETELRSIFAPLGTDLHIETRTCFWWLWYRTT